MSIILAIAASIIVAPVPKQAKFGQWIAVCDNRSRCEAMGLPAVDGSETEWIVRVRRDPGPAALPTGGAAPAYADDGPAEVRLRIDGRSTDFGWSKDRETGGGLTAMMRAIASAQRVEVVDGQGKAVGTLPVIGASAALRWIDDRQKRAGTTTALIARGSKSASAVPAPPPLPTIKQPPASKAPARQLSATDIRDIQKLGDGFCDSERAEATTHRLDANTSVGIVGCLMGAYQGSSLIVVVDDSGKWKPATIEQPEPPGEHFESHDAYFLTSADFSEDQRLLFSAAKGRGIADCGSSASWAWDGRMFRLASYQALHECRGSLPGEWLSRWQTTNDPMPDD